MSNSAFSIYCDFDGTITQGDTVDFILKRLAEPAWRGIEEDWEQGRIGSRECLGRQIPLIQGTWRDIREALNEVHLDPTFAPFARWCREQGFPLRIVSEGIEQIVRMLLFRDGIIVDEIKANHLVEDASGALSLEFPFASADRNCGAGLCKCKTLLPTKSVTNVVIGDGFSDRCWAGKADLLFAKSKLKKHCAEQGIAYTPFEDFRTIRMALEGYIQRQRDADAMGAATWQKRSGSSI